MTIAVTTMRHPNRMLGWIHLDYAGIPVSPPMNRYDKEFTGRLRQASDAWRYEEVYPDADGNYKFNDGTVLLADEIEYEED